MKVDDVIDASDPRLIKLPTDDPNTVAASICAVPGVVGALVVVLRADGELEVSMAGADDERLMRPLAGVCAAIGRHCEETMGPGRPGERREKGQN